LLSEYADNRRFGGDKRHGLPLPTSVSLNACFFMLYFVWRKVGQDAIKKQESTSLKEMLSVLFKNDQLLFTAVSMALFMIGYCTTTTFGTYFFKYAYGDEGMYSVFAGVLGVSQLAALIIFPMFSKRFDRKKLYSGATALWSWFT
jgi:melibiose permease/lactose/raffinose/galactose permease